MAWEATGLNLKGPEGPEGPRGPKGETGSSVTIVGSVANASELPSSGVTEGNGYMAEDTGHLWVRGTDSWNDVGLVRGPEGPEGPSGVPGPAGRSMTSATVNETGNLVLTFSDNVTRDVGAVRGPRGETGPTGPPGESITGPEGPQGQRGSRWYNGSGTPGLTDVQAGDMYLDNDSGDTWRFN